MDNPTILVADGDPKNLQILRESLEASGFEVIIASDGLQAWQKISSDVPDLILSEVNLPKLDGFQLLEKLKADPVTSSIPLMFLTNRRELQDRVRSLRGGVKDYMIKPLHVKEVIARVRMILRRMERIREEEIESTRKMAGRLEEYSVIDLIESFGMERKTGVLTLYNANNKSGEIYFRDGAVVNASLGNLKTEKAVYRMLPWKHGHFTMTFKEIEVPDEISVSNLGLLLQGFKRMEERERLFKMLPSPETTFIITDTFRSIIQKRELSTDAAKFIALIDGKRDILQIIDESTYDDIKTLERLAKLYQQGFIKPSKISITGDEEIDDIASSIAEPKIVEQLSLGQAREPRFATRPRPEPEVPRPSALPEAKKLTPPQVFRQPEAIPPVPPERKWQDQPAAPPERKQEYHDPFADLGAEPEPPASKLREPLPPPPDTKREEKEEQIFVEAVTPETPTERPEVFGAEHDQEESIPPSGRQDRLTPATDQLPDFAPRIPSPDEKPTETQPSAPVSPSPPAPSESVVPPVVEKQPPIEPMVEPTIAPLHEPEAKTGVVQERVTPPPMPEIIAPTQESELIAPIPPAPIEAPLEPKLYSIDPIASRLALLLKIRPTPRPKLIIIGREGIHVSPMVRHLLGPESTLRRLESTTFQYLEIGERKLLDGHPFEVIGISMEQQFTRLLNAAGPDLIGYFLLVEAYRKDELDYLGYLINMLRTVYRRPLGIAVIKSSEQKNMSVDTLRDLLNLTPAEFLDECMPADKASVIEFLTGFTSDANLQCWMAEAQAKATQPTG